VAAAKNIRKAAEIKAMPDTAKVLCFGDSPKEMELRYPVFSPILYSPIN
jgi:hypothetical protein